MAWAVAACNGLVGEQTGIFLCSSEASELKLIDGQRSARIAL
jgi:hypothetical protein